MHLYPMMANLSGKRCLVVGGGQVAERKIRGLLPTGAEIAVVSPDCTAAIRSWAEEGMIALQSRRFAPEDVKGAAVVIAATDDSAVNFAVWEACEPWQWINVVDRPDLCSFHVPSVVERGSLQIAISTGGGNPGLAKKLRRQVEGWIGPEYAEYAAFLGEMRNRVLALPLDERRKRIMLERLLDDRFLQLTREGQRDVRDREADGMIENTALE
jgi:precorrin-2 dehydrogenase/sirohydrochlorin ferrochelatase